MAKDTGWGMHSENFPQQELRHLPTFAKELIAGGVAGGLSKTCVAPLERVKILFQTGMMTDNSVGRTLMKIAREEGPLGWFRLATSSPYRPSVPAEALTQARGNGASVLRVVPYAAFHFTAYEHFRGMMAKRLYGCESRQHHIPPWLDLLAGSGAGGTAVLLTYPLDLVRTRLAYGTESRGMTQSTTRGQTLGIRSSSMTAAGGIPASGRGMHTSSLQAMPSSTTAVNLSSSFRDQQERRLSGQSASTSASLPLQQPQGELPSRRSSRLSSSIQENATVKGKATIRSVLRDTVKAEGLIGLYRGIGPTLLGIVPYAGSKFFLYQTMKQKYWQLQTSGHADVTQDPSKRLPIWLMLSFGGVAGVAAQTMTYPLDVVRRQMQVQHYNGSELSSRFTSTWAGLKQVHMRKGFRALFAGLSINYMKVVPSTAIGFTVYDSAKQYLDLPQNL